MKILKGGALESGSHLVRGRCLGCGRFRAFKNTRRAERFCDPDCRNRHITKVARRERRILKSQAYVHSV